jgi:hypothetical protein
MMLMRCIYLSDKQGASMKKLLISVLLAGAFSQFAWAADDADAKALDESRKTAQEFMQKLGAILKQQLETGGTESAITVCKQAAPALATEYSTNGRVVKRVSLKPRNKALGTPDEWETRKLESAEHALQSGQAISTIEFSEVRDEADGRWLRYLKAIPTQPMCLQCHGKPYQISDSVKAKLAAEYPDDQATGYGAGSIRGAVSIKQKLN